MKDFKLNDMIGGWFVGAFSPSVYSTDSCEVAVKKYAKGTTEAAHYHKVATEITCIVEGQVVMCGKIWNAGDIIVLSPGDVTSFEALTDVVTTVVKVPGTLDDKFLV
ncbi:cupin domain-containing protein [Pantoea sp. Cy-640]|uniref:cupin domain-containing protein n=1 Tax=Pantoea sp. Cy-640 TaxID=2608353 RepID=UPI00141961E3|nr:cupin domain-containing protein [Pantoea sp. Cy-640]NIG14641.1 cupin domain-containing protein [Pantoea sp. Cy-640]